MKRRGLTLVELAVVLVIVALAAALVVPRLSGLVERAALDAAQARVADALRIARAVCRRTGQPLVLVYTSAAVNLVPQDDEAKKPARPLVFPLPQGTKLLSVSLGTRPAALGRKSVAVAFRPEGLCPSHAVVVADDTGRRRRVLSVEALTGRVKIEREGAGRGR